MARGQFGGGEGLYDKPFLIEDAYDLHAVRLFPDKHFKLMYDINLGHTPFTDGNGWRPIDNFSGVLDGNGKSINNLYINTSAELNGLFSEYSNGAVVKNIALKDVNITGGNYTGAVFGRVDYKHSGLGTSINATFAENVSISGRVRANGNHVGALAGTVMVTAENINSNSNDVTVTWGTAFRNIYSTVNLIKMSPGFSYVSGIVGSIASNLIYNTRYAYHWYTQVRATNVINAGNYSESGNNDGRVNPIFTQLNSYRTNDVTNAYVNIDQWRTNLNSSGEEVAYNDRSKALTSEQMKDSSNFAAALTSAIYNGKPIWQFDSARQSEVKLYLSGSDLAFIKFADGGYYVYEGSSWVKKFETLPDLEDAELSGMRSLEDIPSEALEQLKSLTPTAELVSIAKKQSTYYTGNKTLKATEMSNFSTDTKKIYRRNVNFFEFSDGIFNIQTTK